jgi:hypothetical protein
VGRPPEFSFSECYRDVSTINRISWGRVFTDMTKTIDPNDVYYLLQQLLDELPYGTATLERDDTWGRSQLTPVREGAAALYGLGNVQNCEIGIVSLTHSHFHGRGEALEFCRSVVRGEMEYNVWLDGDRIVRAQRIHRDRTIVDVTEALEKKSDMDLRRETRKFEPYV